MERFREKLGIGLIFALINGSIGMYVGYKIGSAPAKVPVTTSDMGVGVPMTGEMSSPSPNLNKSFPPTANTTVANLRDLNSKLIYKTIITMAVNGANATWAQAPNGDIYVITTNDELSKLMSGQFFKTKFNGEVVSCEVVDPLTVSHSLRDYYSAPQP